jgi:putative transposase
LKRLREEGRHTVDENAIFRAIETMRSIADEATSASKIARRQRERRLRVIQGGRADAAPVSGAPKAERQTAEQPWERMLPVEEWS